MGIETTTKISGLNASWPPGTDQKSEGDDHLRLIKGVLQAQFDDSGTTLKTTLPIDSPAGAKVGGKPISTVLATARARNRVNNPTAQVSQENGTSSITASGYAADQWYVGISGITSAAAKNNLAAPSPEGSMTAVVCYASTAKASLAAGDLLAYLLPIEGLDVADLAWGTASAKPVVLRFSAYCQTAGTYGFAVVNSAGDRSFLGSFVITTANVWQTFSFPIPAITTGTWLKDTGIGLTIKFGYAIGSTYVGPATGWQTGNFICPPGCTNGAAVANTSLYITDVGLHADPDITGLAPPFNAPPYEDDLARCQRHWQLFDMQWALYATAGAQVQMVKTFPVEMRATPSSRDFVVGTWTNSSGFSLSLGNVRSGVMLNTAVSTGLTGVYNHSYALSARLI